MSEGLPRFDEDLSYVSQLGRMPNIDNNLTYRDLQSIFDKAPESIKRWLNDVFIPAVESAIGSGTISGIDGSQINDNSIPAGKLANGAISSDAIGNGTVQSENIGTGEVKTVNLEANAVTEIKIKDGAVTGTKLGNKAVGQNNLADNIPLTKFTGNNVAQFNGRIGNITAVEPKFASKTSTAFTEEETPTLTDYPFRAEITDTNVTSNDKVYVEFSPAQINESIYAPFTQSDAGKFYIYSDTAHAAITVQYTILKGTA